MTPTNPSVPAATEPKHTPGPWHVEGFNPPMVYARHGLDIIAQCDSAGEMLDEQEQANAKLIAASPELLSVAKDAAELIRRIPAFGDTIGTEINKAQIGILLRQLQSAISRATS